jgi:DNA repair ATPase RecN
MGQGHLQVRKSVQGGRTTVTVEPLDGVRRVDELARLLGGEQGSGENREAQLAYASRLLAEGNGKGI